MIADKKKSFIYGSLTVVLWSFAFLFTQYASDYFTWQAAVFLRYFFASIALIAMMILRRTRLPKMKDIPKFLLAGFFGFAMFGIVYNISSHTLTSAACGVVSQLTPVITAVFASVFLKEKIRIRGWCAIGICFAGALVVFLWHGFFQVSIGFFWLVLAQIFLSIYNLLQRMFVKNYPAFESTAFSIIGGTCFLLIFVPSTAEQLGNAAPKALISLMALGFLCSALAYVFWSKAFAAAEKTSDVTNLMFASPFLTSIVGFFGRGEIPGPEILIGAVCVISGLVLFQKWK